MESKSNNKCFTSKRPLTGFLPEPYSKHRRVEQGINWCRDIYDIAYIDGVLCLVLYLPNGPHTRALDREHQEPHPVGWPFQDGGSSRFRIKQTTPSRFDQTICSDVEYSVEEYDEADGDGGASKDLGVCFLRCRFDVILDFPKGCGPRAEDNCPMNYTLKSSTGSVNSCTHSDGFSKTVHHREILDQTNNSTKADQLTLTICSNGEYSIEECDEDDSNDEGVSKDVGACLFRHRFDVIRDFPKGCRPCAEDNCPTNNSFKPSSGSIKSCTHSDGFSKTVDHREILDQADNSIKADQSICSDDEYSIEEYNQDDGDEDVSKDLGA
ncbi:hypothetical protein CRG98_026970 [Punica granatum]|uniref:Uncharacterized protein n=1 Tax=Punica granatum TaxID=22663 RepID=A0A2I0J9R6_PUNGR|nr:hypothetical protein CRG98_026970 [Punica granatum]